MSAGERGCLDFLGEDAGLEPAGGGGGAGGEGEGLEEGTAVKIRWEHAVPFGH